MTEHDEDRVRAALQRLRAHDAHAAPAFTRARSSAERALSRRRRRRAAVAGASSLALAAVVLMVVLLRGRGPDPWPRPSFADTEPLAFLARPPSASVVSPVPPYDRAEESAR